MNTQTTHATYGAGNPRLVLHGLNYTQEDVAHTNEAPSYLLTKKRTVIGSSPDADLQLDGLEPEHAIIDHDDRDEYIVTYLAEAQTGINLFGSPGDAVPGPQILRTGSPLQLGNWQLSFYREEFADHGRPHGGRQGGEFDDQEPQEPRPDYTGDTDQDNDDSGEGEPGSERVNIRG